MLKKEMFQFRLRQYIWMIIGVKLLKFSYKNLNVLADTFYKKKLKIRYI
jgi:hypothetical protein